MRKGSQKKKREKGRKRGRKHKVSEREFLSEGRAKKKRSQKCRGGEPTRKGIGKKRKEGGEKRKEKRGKEEKKGGGEEI